MIYSIPNNVALDLSNPHGSDGTVSISFILCKSFNFLTHTVQMEHESLLIDAYQQITFLTHTVQMELSFNSLYNSSSVAFLTHTVQMEQCVLCLPEW